MLMRLAAAAFVFAAIMLTGVGCPGQASAQVVSQRVGVCDPAFPGRCVKPDSNGAIPVTGSFTAAGATAAADCNVPVVAGVSKPQAVNLFSATCVLMKLPDGSLFDWTTLGTAVNQTSVQELINSILGVRTYLHDGQSGAPLSFLDVRAVDQALATTLNSAVTVNADSGLATVRGYLSGVAGGLVVTFEGTNDVAAASPHWSAVSVLQGDTVITTGILSADGNFELLLGGRTAWRARVSTAGTGSPKVSYSMSTAPAAFKLMNSVPAGANLIGSANLAAAATGGCTPIGYQSAASTNATSTKASAGTLCGGIVINTTATLYYLRLYNLAAAPTCSSATGFVTTIPIPASATGAGTLLNFGPFGAAFSTGIAFCLTGGGSSTDNTNAATGVYPTLAYQ